ncbi:hypothetical protein EV361DRAFT_304773 [Lentinula raphanica]|nr:hypothetical protein EV361DRAFT_304773 [Lentinula raphanica]
MRAAPCGRRACLSIAYSWLLIASLSIPVSHILFDSYASFKCVFQQGFFNTLSEPSTLFISLRSRAAFILQCALHLLYCACRLAFSTARV